jgi:hypothetical protein
MGIRERRTGTKVIVYSYSTYVLKSIHKRCSPVLLVAAMQSAAEKGSSRKLGFRQIQFLETQRAERRNEHEGRGVRYTPALMYNPR